MAAFIAAIRTAEITPAVILDVGTYDAADLRTLRDAFPTARCVGIEGDPNTLAAHWTVPPTDVEIVPAIVGAASGPCEWWAWVPMICGVYRHRMGGGSRPATMTT